MFGDSDSRDGTEDTSLAGAQKSCGFGLKSGQ